MVCIEFQAEISITSGRTERRVLDLTGGREISYYTPLALYRRPVALYDGMDERGHGTNDSAAIVASAFVFDLFDLSRANCTAERASERALTWLSGRDLQTDKKKTGLAATIFIPPPYLHYRIISSIYIIATYKDRPAQAKNGKGIWSNFLG